MRLPTPAHLLGAMCVLAVSAASAQVVVNSTFQPRANSLYSNSANWTPQEVPNNSAEKSYNVTILNSVGLDIDATVSSLRLDGMFFTEDHSFTVLGPTTVQSGSINVVSRGSGGATFRTASLSSITDGVLTGMLSVNNNAAGAGWATLQFNGANITELRGGHVTLRGPMTRIIDEAGNNALRNLRVIDSESVLNMVGQQFSISGPLTHEGTLMISSGFNHPALLAVNGGLTNYNPTTRTLTGGYYYVGSYAHLGGDAAAVLQITGADIATNASTVELTGPAARMTDELGRDAFRNLARNAQSGSLRIAGHDFTTAGDFTNDGNLTVERARFVVSGKLTNFDPATKTLAGGSFTIGALQPAVAELRFSGADVVRNAATLTIYGNGIVFRDENGNDGLRNFAFNDAAGTLNAPLRPGGDFTNAGRVVMREFTMAPGRTYLQTSGQTVVAQGPFTGSMQINGGLLTGSNEETAAARINGTLQVGDATLALGQLYVKGSVTLGAQTRVTITLPPPDTYYLNGVPGLTVEGQANLAGTLDIEDPGDFPPPSDAFYTAIQCTTLAGQFANAPGGTRVSTRNGRGTYIVTYQNNAVLIGGYQRAEPAAQLLNVSTRAKVRSGQNVTIGGFIVYGFAPKKVALRGIGPSLASRGVSGPLEDPAIELHDSSGNVIARNNDWRETQADEISQAGLAPTDDREAALIKTLPRGAYTVVLRGATESDGTGLVEVYDLASESRSKLANISTRGFVDAVNPLIGGMISGGSGTGRAELTVRAIGPGLRDANVLDYLPDPALEVRDRDGTMVARNDDYSSPEDNYKTIGPSLYPRYPNDAATGLVIPAGQYTVLVLAKAGDSGVALVEIYDLNR